MQDKLSCFEMPMPDGCKKSIILTPNFNEMGLFAKIKKKLHYKTVKFFHSFTKPAIIGGFRRHDGVLLRNSSYSNTSYIGPKEKFHIEDYVFIGHYCYIDSKNGISIAEGCQITNFVSILSHSSHIPIRLYGRALYDLFPDLDGMIIEPVSIGAYTFVGPHVTIMPGTKIGKGCIVSAFSYVKGDFPDYSIIQGTPAKVTGDTRDLDKEFISKNPDLQKHYDSWSKEK